MLPRDSEKTLKELARGYPLIAITGPRQSGKTTLARHVFNKKAYVSLENPDIQEFATNDPRGFLNKYSDGAVLDEIQRTPELFSYLQGIVDEAGQPGHFILTGSQQFGLMSNISQTLAGRVAMVHLLPFTLHECYRNSIKKSDLDNLMFKGLYPPVHDKKLEPVKWFTNYMQTYIERDVRSLVNVRDLNSFQRFVKLCAGRSGQLLNLSDLASDCGITHNTAKAWISILEASYIIFLLQPHHNNFNKRIIKSPKLYFYDTGLLCWLLSIHDKEQLNVHSMRGAIFETFIISEFIKSRFNLGLPGNYYFWRDRKGNEIDLIQELGEKLRPVEIKSGQTLNDDFFKGLKNWISLAGANATKPALIYGGYDSLKYSNINVYSWTDKTPFSKI